MEAAPGPSSKNENLNIPIGKKLNKSNIDPLESNLPSEIIYNVFSHLDEKSKKAGACVDTKWNAAIIDQNRAEQSAKVIKLIRIGIDHLKKESSANEKELSFCRELLEKNSCSNATNLGEIKEIVVSLKDPLAQQFKNLSKERFDSLIDRFDHQEMPVGFENYIDAVQFYHELHIALQLTDDDIKSIALYKLAKSQLDIGHYVYSLVAADLIPSELYKIEIGYQMFFDYVSKKMFAEAVEYAQTFKEGNPSNLLKLLSSKLIEIGNETGNFDDALKTLSKMPAQLVADKDFEDISLSLMKWGNFIKALEVANMIKDARQRIEIIKQITSEQSSHTAD